MKQNLQAKTVLLLPSLLTRNYEPTFRLVTIQTPGTHLPKQRQRMTGVRKRPPSVANGSPQLLDTTTDEKGHPRIEWLFYIHDVRAKAGNEGALCVRMAELKGRKLAERYVRKIQNLVSG